MSEDRPVGFRCPFCNSRDIPAVQTEVSSGGWVVFVWLLLSCIGLPFCWLGLLMKNKFRVCGNCGTRIGQV